MYVFRRKGDPFLILFIDVISKQTLFMFTVYFAFLVFMAEVTWRGRTDGMTAGARENLDGEIAITQWWRRMHKDREGRAMYPFGDTDEKASGVEWPREAASLDNLYSNISLALDLPDSRRYRPPCFREREIALSFAPFPCKLKITSFYNLPCSFIL